MARNDGYMPLGFGVGTTVAARYEIEKKLGSGGMSAVFVARDKALNNEQCALKVLEPRLVQEGVDLERFRNEVLITRKLTHPNIVRSYEFGRTDSGSYFVTMEYVRGKTLQQLIYDQNGNELSYGDIVRIIRDIAIGLDYAHSMGVVHRDLKPANVLISNDNEVKIADFGLAQAKELELRLTQTGECVGTPAYMAPEQIQGHEIDYRTDIYALGILGYEMVTQSLPYEASDWYALASQIITQPLPNLANRKEKVPKLIADFISKASEKEPSKRFQSTAEIVSYLDSELDKTAQWSNAGIWKKRNELLTQPMVKRAPKNDFQRLLPMMVMVLAVLTGMLMVVMLKGGGGDAAQANVVAAPAQPSIGEQVTGIVNSANQIVRTITDPQVQQAMSAAMQKNMQQPAPVEQPVAAESPIVDIVTVPDISK